MLAWTPYDARADASRCGYGGCEGRRCYELNGNFAIFIRFYQTICDAVRTIRKNGKYRFVPIYWSYVPLCTEVYAVFKTKFGRSLAALCPRQQVRLESQPATHAQRQPIVLSHTQQTRDIGPLLVRRRRPNFEPTMAQRLVFSRLFQSIRMTSLQK